MSRVRIDLPKTFHFATDIPVRIDDINYGGHLGNAALLSVLQEARVQMLKQKGWSELDIEGVGFLMTDAAVMYRAEVFYGDGLTVEVGVSDRTETGCDVVYRVTRKSDAREVARAKTGITFFNYSTRKVVGMPGKFKEAFP
jgi:acyl-CoA thioesterase FadM